MKTPHPPSSRGKDRLRSENARVESSSMLPVSPETDSQKIPGAIEPLSKWGSPTSGLVVPKAGKISGTTTLLADAELADHNLITLGVVFLQIVQQTTALADQHEKSAARAVVFFVRLEVLRQLPNPLAQQCDLYFRTSRIACMRAVLVNEGFLLLSG